MKCFRNRFTVKFPNLFLAASSVFRWIIENDDNDNATARMLVAFSSAQQRNDFLSVVTIPKGTQYWFGNIDKL